MISATYQVTGMTCEHCTRAVREELTALAGVSGEGPGRRPGPGGRGGRLPRPANPRGATPRVTPRFGGATRPPQTPLGWRLPVSLALALAVPVVLRVRGGEQPAAASLASAGR